MSSPDAIPTWRVRRVSGLLPPGFTKRFDGAVGVTRWCGIPVDRVDVVRHGDRWALRYRHLPIRDVLAVHPGTASTDVARVDAEAFLLLPGGRRVRFCRFRLERRPD